MWKEVLMVLLLLYKQEKNHGCCLLLFPQYQVFFEFNDRMEAVMKKAYIYR